MNIDKNLDDIIVDDFFIATHAIEKLKESEEKQKENSVSDEKTDE